ncbi:hypothetical protein OJAV_G00049250 [Oryzias javanicus]|uniref:RNA helicase n=1 Tax=Oryzias javanicus TaxID=123683 RepID=A0A3S2MSL2_ORYJA|nr:hypothetical protein OJAV_G00049250 [Oryzias javanicus]
MFGGNAEGLQTLSRFSSGPGRSDRKLLSLEILRSNLLSAPSGGEDLLAQKIPGLQMSLKKSKERTEKCKSIQHAVADLGWSQPTLIQEKAVPLALEGKDLLAGARTGSGKTAAYAVPIIQHILTSKQSVREQAVRALVLVPTKELGQQVQTVLRQLTSFCSRDVRVADISSKADVSSQRPILMEKPDVVVGTPSRVLAHINAHNLDLQASLEVLVVDEADLIFWFGFEADLKSLLR